MADDLQTLLVRLDADVERLRRGMKRGEQAVADTGKKMGRVLDKMDSRFKQLGVGLAAAFSVRAIKNFLSSTVNAASGVEEMQSKFKVVFGSLSSDVEQWAAVHGKAVNRSRFDLQEYAASLQDFFVPMGFSRKEAAELSKGLSELTVDVASFNNQLDADVLVNFRAALAGSSETVLKYGIDIRETALKQELMRTGQDQLTGSALNLAKVQARYNLILRGTKDSQGDAARTSGTFANQMKGLAADTKDAAVAIGDRLLPVAGKLVAILRKIASGVKGAFDETPSPILLFGKDLDKARVKAQQLRAMLKTMPTGGGGPAAQRARIGAQASALEAQDPALVIGQAQTDLAAARARLAKVEGGGANIGGRPLTRGQRKTRAAQAREDIAALEVLIATTKELIRLEGQVPTKEEEGGEPKGLTIISRKKTATNEQQALAALDKILDKRKAANAFLDERNDLQIEYLKATGEEAKAIRMIGEARKAEIKLTAEAMGATKAEVAEIMRQIDAITEKTIETSKNALDANKALAEQIAATFRASLFDIDNIGKSLLRIFANAALFGSDGKGGLLGGAISGLSKGIGKAFGGLFGGKAGGGSISVPTLVGERGPEIVSPKGSAVVHNASDTRRMLGGGRGITINQVIRFDVGLETVDNRVQQAAPIIAAATVAAIQDSDDRDPGGF